jgi:hypothetical protein
MDFSSSTTIHCYCNAAACFGPSTGPSLGLGKRKKILLERSNMHAKYKLHLFWGHLKNDKKKTVCFRIVQINSYYLCKNILKICIKFFAFGNLFMLLKNMS